MNPLEQLVQKLNAQSLWEKEIQLKRNAYLKTRGSLDTRIYLINEGSLRMYYEDETEEHTIRFAYQGNIIAALDSYISEKPSALIIQALKKTTLQFMSKSRFVQFLQSSEEHLNLWLVIMEQLVYQQMEREQDILTSSPAERYQRVLKRSPQVFQEIPNKYIASYLRMTPETLSRLKKS